MLNESKPYVYFIQCHIFVKIGVSWAPDIRMEDIQSHNPHELNLIGVIKDGGFEREKEIHEQFYKDKVHGEWFNLSEELITFIKKNTIKWKTRIYEVK